MPDVTASGARPQRDFSYESGGARLFPRPGLLTRWLWLLVLAPGASAASGPAAAPDCTQAAPFSVRRYQADLELDVAGQSLLGRETVTVEAGNGPARVLAFDAPGLAVEAAESDGPPLPSVRDGDRLCVGLQSPLRPGQSIRISFRYQARASSSLRFFPDHVYTAYGTSRWLVSLDDPAQRATLALRLTVPGAWLAIGAGEAPAPEGLADGRLRYTFAQRHASPGFLFGFAAGRLRVATRREGQVLLRAAAPESLAVPDAELQNVLEVTARALRFLAERAGVPLPEESYSQVFVGGDEEQEAAGFALERASYLAELRADPREDWLPAHELAHQYWAYLLPCQDFADFWLNEGLATFMVAAFKESRWGRAAYEDELALFRTRYARALAAGKDQALAPRPAGATVRGITYSKGALVLHLLRSELGETAFWEGLRRYTQANAGQGVRTAQLQAAFEAASGRDLSRLFAQWVASKSPAPVQVRHRWQAGQLVLDVEAGELVPLTLDVAWEDAHGVRATSTVSVTQGRQTVELPVPEAPVAVRVDAGARLPLGVAHGRPLAMLLHQLEHEPDTPGRLDALQRVVETCRSVTPECQPVREALRRSAAQDQSWLIRAEAQEALGASPEP